MKKYKKEQQAFIKKQQKDNSIVKKLKQQYENNEEDAVAEYICLILERSQYPASLYEKNVLGSEINYDKKSSLALIDIILPNLDQVPHIKEYKYVASRNESTPVEMSKKELGEFYNQTIYQIILRTVYEVFNSDYKNNIQVVVINGWVDGVDSHTGKDFRNCIVSLQTTKEAFDAINLSAVVPADCFKHLKGVSAGSFAQLAPVKPIMEISTDDNRIITASEVISELDEGKNLAIMDWQEFEVLVRDIIGREFSNENCQVEVTRASRDAGVDAIAFDQDPLKGGKYVIQAKRYNNLVPVGAVRDLYGTVMNEGAVKGILITTSYYGPDSMEFVKDKPLTLINGEQLLYLFNKHGFNFRIELNKKKAASNKAY